MSENKQPLVDLNWWCKKIVEFGYIASALIILAHVIWLLAKGIMRFSPEVYLRDYIILPAIVLFASNVFVDRIVRSDKTTLLVKEYCSLFLLAAYSFYLCITHDISRVLLCSFILPIVVSSIFSNISLSRHLFIVSLVGVFATIGKAYVTGTLNGTLIMEFFVTLFMLICTYFLIKLLIQFEQNNQRVLKKINEDAVRNELAFYQAQINPHFLCNVINTVISLCYTDKEKTAKLLANLTNYLQFTFDFDAKLMMVSLEKEIQLIKAYVEIEKARFGERISVKYNIEPELLNMQMPSFCLQPLVENAIKHGLYKKATGGTVTITARKENDILILSVSDTGVGMTKEKMNQLMTCKDSSEGVGFYNVKRRILGWRNSQFDIQSKEGEGTTITMRISGNDI